MASNDLRSKIFYARDHDLADGMNWVIPGKLIAGNYLGSIQSESEIIQKQKMKFITDQKVTTIVDLTEDQEELHGYDYPKDIITRYRFPIKDETADNDDEVMKAVATILSIIRYANKGLVYVHCKGGHGRSGVVVSVVLGQYLKLSADMAMYITSATHATRPYQNPKEAPSSSPQTDDQVEQVRKLLGNVAEDDNVYAATARRLFSIYEKKCKPPDWVIAFMNTPKYVSYARRARCYSADGRTGAVRKVLTERQPVNIAMHLLLYDKRVMQSSFGFGGEVSGYTDLARAQTTPREERRLPPNISVYCYTPMRSDNGGDLKMRHVINSVGVALDEYTQPDYKIVFAKPESVGLSEIKRVVREAYQCLLACARDLNLQKIAICHLGGKSFARLYPGESEAYIRDVWLPVVSTLLNEEGQFLTEVMLLGAESEHSSGVTSLREALKIPLCIVSPGFKIPGSAFKEGSEAVLFQNAWDPHSIAGNGNTFDNSLDGFFGRSSAISVLSFPATNPFIEIKTISVKSTINKLLWISS
jgi:protein-tyrosine phosphatase